MVDSVQAVNALYPMQQNTLIEQSGTNKAQNLGIVTYGCLKVSGALGCTACLNSGKSLKKVQEGQ